MRRVPRVCPRNITSMIRMHHNAPRVGRNARSLRRGRMYLGNYVTDRVH